jgi:hypothetical protein
MKHKVSYLRLHNVRSPIVALHAEFAIVTTAPRFSAREAVSIPALRSGLSLFALFAFLVTTPVEAKIEYKRVTANDGTRFLIVKGEFEFSDDESELTREIANFQPRPIGFDSPGGNIDAGMRLGRTIRSLGLSTMQIRATLCASACSLAFLGGVQRLAEPGSIGVHKSSFLASTDIDSKTAV